MTKSALLISALFAGSALISTGVLAKETKLIEKSFSVSSGSMFTLDGVNGSVEIERGNGDSILVTAEVTADSQEDLERITVKMAQDGDRVSVETKHKKSDWGRNHSSGKVEYTVVLPVGMADTEIDLVNGSLRLTDLDGDIDVDLVNGSIKAKGLKGNSKISSVNGSVKVAYDAVPNSVERIDLESVNGSITLALPTDAQFTLDAETMHGSINTDFGLKADKNFFTGKNLKGEVGNGSIKINAESVNGGIDILFK